MSIIFQKIIKAVLCLYIENQDTITLVLSRRLLLVEME